jgi:hypothetical protein
MGFVYLDLPVERGLLRFDHCCWYAMAEIPGCFIADSESALRLARGHALLRFREQVRSGKPFRRKL